MNKEQKILLAIDKGITCNPDTGEIFGVRGNVITNKHTNGYIRIGFFDNKLYNIYAHQFIYYCVHKKVVDCIDHINRIKNDNRIINLRSVTTQQNRFNVKYKGYSWHKRDKKWRSSIMISGKNIYLGSFITEDEAQKSYLEAKKKYHQI